MFLSSLHLYIEFPSTCAYHSATKYNSNIGMYKKFPNPNYLLKQLKHSPNYSHIFNQKCYFSKYFASLLMST